jgi:hypothetical protein
VFTSPKWTTLLYTTWLSHDTIPNVDVGIGILEGDEMMRRVDRNISPPIETQLGQGLVEYAILLTLVALAAVLTLTSVGEKVAQAFGSLNLGRNDFEESDTLVVTALDLGREGIQGVRVFAYSDQGDYLDSYLDTDGNGNALFQLEDGRYQFLAQYQQNFYWSDVVVRPGQNTAEIQTSRAPFKVIVVDTAANGVAEAAVHAYTEDEKFMGVSGQTTESGIWATELVDANVKFRVDFDGKTQWSDVVPTSQDEITITLSPCGSNQYLAEYFNNRNLAGSPVVTRCEEAISYDWGSKSPDEGIEPNNFSARWTGQFQIDAATYTFRTTADDGVRTWLDGELLTDAWTPQPATTYAARQVVEAGNHEIKMEYFEAYGNAVAKLRWEEVIDSCPTGQFLAEYFNNRNLSGDPEVVRCENSINYDWGTEVPVANIKSNNFSVRWSGKIKFNAGTYQILVTGDDGIRAWVDNEMIVNAWKPQSETTYASRQELSAGIHDIKLEYYEQGGDAVAKMSWREAIASCPIGQFMAEYFNNRNLNGEPVLVRCETDINYNWGTDAPVSGVNSDNFSVRWTGRIKFIGGQVTFKTTTDDGMQLFVDNDLLIGAWYPQRATEHTAVTDLASGEHEITVNYYEQGGQAVAKVRWE